MHLKDYYGILEIESSATQQEIKKAFRQLAHQFHPDKNLNDPYATSRFAEVKEAYEVLTNPAKKEYYLQQRWYNQSLGKRKTQGSFAPVTILKQALELDKYVSKLDIHRMHKQGLADYICEMLSDSVVAQLLIFNESEINDHLIITTLKAMGPLKYTQAEIVSRLLFKLAGDHEENKKMISELLNLKKEKEKVDKYRPLIILLIVIIICFLIWWMGR